ncbi:hypothetical protein [Streptomyces viridochromogenes]|uniref:Putative Cytochrome n=1 Tax=Streptomyces viridochromogenes Tue57 TaxID=1160705 RepID=L8PN47_STRVR|nr:hypothetical protein [Streptomyces viridochromogenes]ELS57449.1 putative Cytochrome [Streptomyces viridochromogenes Tue57]
MTVPDAPPVAGGFDPRQYTTGVPYDACRVLRDHCPLARQDEPDGIKAPPVRPT